MSLNLKKDSCSIVGESKQGAGKGRYRVIKAVNKVDHLHGMVHVLAMEIGLIKPYFDEGLATALEPGSRIETRKDCQKLKDIVNEWADFLDGSTFNSSQMSQKINVYGLAQVTMRYWLEKFGIESVKKVIAQTVRRPDSFRKHIEKYFGSSSDTAEAVKLKLEKMCSRLS